MAVKLYVQYHKNDSGKGKFIERLIPAMREFGIKCMSTPKGCDVTMGVTWFKEKTGSMPKILRIDGVHLSRTGSSKWKNAQVEKQVAQAHLIIWQSEFCRQLAGKLTHAAGRRCVTIFNGAPVVELPAGHRRGESPLMAAKWWASSNMPRRHKRLYYHAAIANAFWKETGITTTIAGDVYNQRDFEGEGVRYTGQLSDADLQAQMRSASMYVYVPYFDWCPNAVVEAMANHCNVICGNIGGHAEMVDGYGTVLQLDETIHGMYGEHKCIPQPPIEPVVAAMVSALEHRDDERTNVKTDIRTVAKQYADAIKGLLCIG